MELRRLLQEDDSAVSPVIGVILMVAITVILAAVIASFVLGMGPDTATTPTATFDSEEINDGNALKITMQNGESFNEGSVTIHGTDNSTGTNPPDDGATWSEYKTDTSEGDELKAGSEVIVAIDGDYEVRLVYEEGDTTSTIRTFEGAV